MSRTVSFVFTLVMLSIGVADSGCDRSSAQATPTVATPAQIEGFVDVVTCDTIRGWGRDAAAPKSRLTLQVLDGETILAEVVADRYRDDLRLSNHGDGNSAFIMRTPSALADGKEHTIRVRVAGTQTLLGNGVQKLRCEP